MNSRVRYRAEELSQLYDKLSQSGAMCSFISTKDQETYENLEYNFADRVLFRSDAGTTDKSYAEIKYAMYDATIEDLPLLINEPILGPIAIFRLQHNKIL